MAVDREALKRIIEKAYSETMSELSSEFQAVISDLNAFPGFVDQDIIDTGEFKASQQLNRKTRFNSVFNWDPISEDGYHYAAGLHTGFWAWGHTYIPGRNWTGLGIKRNKPVTLLAKKLKTLGFSVKFKDNSDRFYP